MVRKILFFSFLTLFCVGVSGCGSQEAVPENEPKQRSLSHLPKWVLSPEIEGYLSGVGYAKPQRSNPAYQRRVAMMQAKAAIGRAIEVYVRTELSMEKRCGDEACRSEMTTRSQHLSRQLIGESTLMNEWTDPKTGILYIRLVVKKEEIKE